MEDSVKLNLLSFVDETRSHEFVSWCAEIFFKDRIPERNPHISFRSFMDGVEAGIKSKSNRISGNVVDFPGKEFAEYRIDDGVISVISKCNGLEVLCRKADAWMILNGEPLEFDSRRAMAEFLWMAVRFVDSDGAWEKEKYVGCDYM